MTGILAFWQHVKMRPNLNSNFLKPCDTLDQACQTGGPRAACGPIRNFCNADNSINEPTSHIFFLNLNKRLNLSTKNVIV